MDKTTNNTNRVKVDQDSDTHTVGIDDCSTVVDREESLEEREEERMSQKKTTKCSDGRLESFMANVRSGIVGAGGRLAGFGKWVFLQIIDDHRDTYIDHYEHTIFTNHTWYRAELESKYLPGFFSKRYKEKFQKDAQVLIDKAYKSFDEVRKCKIHSDAEREAFFTLFKMMTNDYAWLNNTYPWIRTDFDLLRRNKDSYAGYYRNDLDYRRWYELKMKHRS